MEATDLRNLLRSFCANSQWNYAVFWKLRCENEPVLTWEEGYLDQLKPRMVMENMSEDSFWTDVGWTHPLRSETLTDDVLLEELSIEEIVATTSDLQYSFEQGIVGEVAYTGAYLWILYDDIILGDFGSDMVNKCPSEWLLQFASGIKVIHPPYGHVLYSSVFLVADDCAGASTSTWGITVWLFGIETSDGGSWTLDFIMNYDNKCLVAEAPCYVSSVQNLFTLHYEYGVEAVNGNTLRSGKEQVESDSQIQEQLQVRREHPKTCQTASGEAMDVLSFCGLSDLPSNSDDSQLHMNHNLSDFSCMVEEYHGNSLHNSLDIDTSESMMGYITAYLDENLVEDFPRDANENDTANDSLESFLWFSEDSELYKALTPKFNSIPMNSLNIMDQVRHDRNLTGIAEPFFDVTDSVEQRVDYLLEAVIANVCCGSHAYNPQSSIDTSEWPSHPPQSQSACALVEQEAVLLDNLASASHYQENCNLTASVPLQNLANSVTHNDRIKQSRRPKKGKKLSGVSKRKLRPCGTEKFRPRDRQLMQDRIKELRELIPDSGKSSIDGLFEQTLRHMRHLQRVTDQSVKLKKWAYEQEYSGSSSSSSKIKTSHESRTTYGSRSRNSSSSCPIFVEDLAESGHMLIKMPCREPGFFLEFAMVFRNLELAIIKGTMEKQEGDSWVHFIVEAKKGFQKSDIFWPLMQLWQRQTQK